MSDIYAPPTSDVSPEAITSTEDNFILASRLKRWVGSIIDTLIFTVPIIALAVFAVFFLNESTIIHRLFVNEITSGILGSLLGIAIHTAVNFVLMRDGQTIGKKLMNTQIRTLDNQIPTVQEQIFKRYLFQFGISAIPAVDSLLVLVNALFIFGKEKRCLHDIVGGTKVVDKPVSSETLQNQS